jgi:hypothetical protein|tara:strand:- start:1125 stop:1715 length:591 start_codon:yes stop_codon:yes gene_type:complete
LRYKANITAGALLVYESRKIAGLMLTEVSPDEWKQVIEDQNILQRLSPASSIRIANFIRSRLRLMTPDLWELVKDGDSVTATQACLAAAIKHCRLLGDYLDIVVRGQFNKLEDRLTPRLWEDFVLGCRQRDPEMDEFPSTTAKKMRTNIHRILNEAGYLKGGRKWLLQRVDILPEILRYLKNNDEEYVLRCMQVTK